MAPFTRSLRAYEGETVEIRWRCADGAECVQRVTIPPKATREDRQLAEQLLDEVAATRNAAGQVIDRPHTTAAGQRTDGAYPSCSCSSDSRPGT